MHVGKNTSNRIPVYSIAYAIRETRTFPPNQQPYLHYQSLQCLFIALVSYRTDVWGQKDIAEDSWMLQYRQLCHAPRSVKVKADISEVKLLTKKMTAEKKFKCLSFYSFLFFFFFVIVCLVAVLSSKLCAQIYWSASFSIWWRVRNKRNVRQCLCFIIALNNSLPGREKNLSIFSKNLWFFFLQDSVVFGSALNIKFGHLVTFK